MAFIVEQAGVKRQMVLKHHGVLNQMHQRVPFFCGSYNMVEKSEVHA
jgi:fructose-1,6-bisphosphatase I